MPLTIGWGCWRCHKRGKGLNDRLRFSPIFEVAFVFCRCLIQIASRDYFLSNHLFVLVFQKSCLLISFLNDDHSYSTIFSHLTLLTYCPLESHCFALSSVTLYLTLLFQALNLLYFVPFIKLEIRPFQAVFRLN